MGILKNNTGIDWSERSDPRYPDPMITLRRLGSGRLTFDDMIHRKRIELTTGKAGRLEAAKAQLRAAILFAVRWYSNESWPLTISNLLKDKEQFLPPKIRDMAIKSQIKPMIDTLINDGVLKQIRLQGRGSVTALDSIEGQYFTGKQTERRADVPALQWSHTKYDEENEEYIALENVQHIMDI
jgi:hypothetical protein